MDIVINNCYGGFGLSSEAVLKLIKMKSEVVTTMPYSEYSQMRDWKKEWGKSMKIKGTTKYRRDYFIPGMLYSEDETVYFVEGHKLANRTHPDLIKLVREMGTNVNGPCSKLKIVRIPKDVEWTIEEYKGNECVSEKHRKWS